MRIKLIELIGPKCVALEDGNKLYPLLLSRLKDRKDVELDFSGVTTVFSPFLMGSFGKLLDHFEKETLMARVHLCNIAPDQLKTVNEFIDRAERQATEQSDLDTLRDLFEEDEVGDI